MSMLIFHRLMKFITKNKFYSIIAFIFIINLQMLSVFSPSLNITLTHHLNSNLNVDVPKQSIKPFNFYSDNNKLFFEENFGQLHDNLTYYYYSGDNFFVQFQNSSILNTIWNNLNNRSYIVKFSVLNSNPSIPVGISSQNNSNIYYFGTTKFTNFEYSELLYSNIYNNIDLIYFITPKGIKYNFIVHPGGSPNDILVNITTSLNISYNKSTISFYTQNDYNNIVFQDSDLQTYQISNRIIDSSFDHEINGHYNNCYGFKIGSYDKTKNLIIDPYWLVLNENLGLSEQNSNSIQANGFQFDSDGNIIVLGQFKNSVGFYHILVSKYSADGAFLKTTSIGGNSNDNIEINQNGKSIAIDDNNNIYITGYTTSNNLLSGGFQKIKNGEEDAFVIKLNDNLETIWRTYLGGYSNDRGRSIVIYHNEIFVSGMTASSNFPLKNALENKYNGGSADGFITKFNSTGSLIFSTYFGGNGEDEIHTSAIDSQGNLIVTGATKSNVFNPNLINTSYPPIQQHIGSVVSFDSFITKLTNDGQNIIFSSYLGGTDIDVGNDVQIDSSDNIFIMGTTLSSPFVNSDQFINKWESGTGGQSSIFIVEMNTNDYIFTKYATFDGNNVDNGSSMVIDSSENLVLTGNTRSTNFWNGTTGIESNSSDKSSSEMFVSKINRKTGNLDLSSIIREDCPTVSCVYKSQEIKINNNNSIVLLGNNKYLNSDGSFYWKPIH